LCKLFFLPFFGPFFFLLSSFMATWGLLFSSLGFFSLCLVVYLLLVFCASGAHVSPDLAGSPVLSWQVRTLFFFDLRGLFFFLLPGRWILPPYSKGRESREYSFLCWLSLVGDGSFRSSLFYRVFFLCSFVDSSFSFGSCFPPTRSAEGNILSLSHA